MIVFVLLLAVVGLGAGFSMALDVAIVSVSNLITEYIQKSFFPKK